MAASSLTRRFGDITTVDHIDLHIPYGQIFAILAAIAAKVYPTLIR